MTQCPNILVVCGRNKKRSKTAEHIFKNDQRFNIRSAGVSPQSNRKISENDLQWADIVFVMEQNQKAKIKEVFSFLTLPLIENLNIPDDYEFMDDELIDIFEARMNDSISLVF